MPQMLILPFWPPVDNTGAEVTNAKIWLTQAGNNTPTPGYSDDGLSVARTNPIPTDAAGKYPTTYLDQGVSYRVRVYRSTDTLGVSTPLDEYDPYSAFETAGEPIAVANAAALLETDGSNLVGYNPAETFGPGTVGKELQKLSPRQLGPLPAGTTLGLEIYGTASQAHAGGTTDFRNVLIGAWLEGNNSATQLSALNLQSEARHAAGTLSFQYGIQGYNRLGRLGSNNGPVLTSRGIEWHIANESNAHINEAFTFYAQGIDLADGTGTIDTVCGFRAGDMGHATRITTLAASFYAAAHSTGAPISAGFYSDQGGGAGKWGVLIAGGANNGYAGRSRFGSVTAPSDTVEISGFLKANRNGTPLATGTRHEITSDNNDYILDLFNSSAAGPRGLHLKFSGMSPNNTTQDFITAEDSTTQRFRVWSNGNVVNTLNSYGAISDRSLKRDIRKSKGGHLRDILAMQLYNYRLAADGARSRTLLGVMADEAGETCPGLRMRHNMRETKRGTFKIGKTAYPYEVETTREVDGWNYSVMALKSMGAVQELAARVAKLEGKHA